MKKLFTSSVLLIFTVASTFAATHQITIPASTFGFSPVTTMAVEGDVIEFVLSGVHTATQVSQSTWNSSGNTPLGGGFNFSGAGTHSYTLTSADVGTIYFVCSPHASMGMKGTIGVTATTPVYHKITAAELSAYPNPTTGVVTIDNNEPAQVQVYDQFGIVVKDVYIDKNGQVDLSDLKNGVYFVSVVNGDKREKVGRVVKK